MTFCFDPDCRATHIRACDDLRKRIAALEDDLARVTAEHEATALKLRTAESQRKEALSDWAAMNSDRIGLLQKCERAEAAEKQVALLSSVARELCGWLTGPSCPDCEPSRSTFDHETRCKAKVSIDRALASIALARTKPKEGT